MSDKMARLSGFHERTGNEMASFGGFLRCETCRRTEGLDGQATGVYLKRGWPRCCGYTMRWWTQRQVDAGEVPE
jgi:hypothetical protein